MNTDEVMQALHDHWEEAAAAAHLTNSHVVGIFLQGSQNYGLDYEGSDIDTKLIVTPSFKEICLNRVPISTTYVRKDQAHTDIKDIRKYIETFYKQNLNFLEILFTPYSLINEEYLAQWQQLVDNNEAIARMNPYRAVKSMKGIAMEKYHAMEHPYPSKLDLIQEKGYDGKQVHHLLRVEDYLSRYINGESYSECLRPSPGIRDRLMAYKRQEIPLDVARNEAAAAINHVVQIADAFCEKTKEKADSYCVSLLEDTCYEIMKRSVSTELI